MLLDSTQDLAYTLHKPLQSRVHRIAFYTCKLYLNLILGRRTHHILILEEAHPAVVAVCVAPCAPNDGEVKHKTLSLKRPATNHAECLLLLLPARKEVANLGVIVCKTNLTTNLDAHIVVYEVNIRVGNSAVLDERDEVLASEHVVLAILLDCAESLETETNVVGRRNRHPILLCDGAIPPGP